MKGTVTERVLDKLLTDDAGRAGVFWKAKEISKEGRAWDRLASADHIMAAISAVSEESERRKSKAGNNFLKANLDGGVVLDLGCGYGRAAKYLLHDEVLDGYIGVDGSSVMLEKFHERYSGAARERRTPLLLLQSDIDRLPLEDASVDAVITCAVFLHNHKKITQRSLREVHRILKPGGKLIALGSFLNVFNLTGAQGSAYLALLKVLAGISILPAGSGPLYTNTPLRTPDFFIARCSAPS